jgi:hypothetical protein
VVDSLLEDKSNWVAIVHLVKDVFEHDGRSRLVYLQ